MLVKVQPDTPNPRTGKDAKEAAKAVKPPERRSDETLEAYGDRLRWDQARQQKDKPKLFERPLMGYVGTAHGPKPWWTASYLGGAGRSGADGTPTDAASLNARPNPAYRNFTHTFPELPAVQERTQDERYADVSAMLFALAAQSYAEGQMHLPRSVSEKLVRLGVYKTLEDVLKATPQEVFQSWERYALHLLERRNVLRSA